MNAGSPVPQALLPAAFLAHGVMFLFPTVSVVEQMNRNVARETSVIAQEPSSSSST